MGRTIWLWSTRRWRRWLDASLDCSFRSCSCRDGSRIHASVWRSACRTCKGARHAAPECEYIAEGKGGVSEQVRGLPFERDAMAGVFADCPGVVADRTGYRRGAQEDGPVAMGGDAEGETTGVNGEDCAGDEEWRDAATAVSRAALERKAFNG